MRIFTTEKSCYFLKGQLALSLSLTHTHTHTHTHTPTCTHTHTHTHPPVCMHRNTMQPRKLIPTVGRGIKYFQDVFPLLWILTDAIGFFINTCVSEYKQCMVHQILKLPSSPDKDLNQQPLGPESTYFTTSYYFTTIHRNSRNSMLGRMSWNNPQPPPTKNNKKKKKTQRKITTDKTEANATKPLHSLKHAKCEIYANS